MKPRRKRELHLCALLVVLEVALVGCTSHNRDFLDRPLPDSTFLPASLSDVWSAMEAAAARPDFRVLVRDPETHILSWISEVEKDSPLHASLADPEMATRKGRVMALTLLRAKEVRGGCELFIRQTYLPARWLDGGISASRGAYEEAILHEIRRRLAPGG